MIELNLDGLVGPTHHYAGLAFGNQASTQHARQVSNPKAAAQEGLKKMWVLCQLGVPQAVMPPPLRPNLVLLHALGFRGTPAQQVQQAFKVAPHLLSACYSASSMWTANAATVSASPDTADGRVHFTPANLISQVHRAQETVSTAALLKTIFQDERFFKHHPPLPLDATFSDEGAANHSRLCQTHARPGLSLFVYGKAAFKSSLPQPTHYPARQTLEASESIARLHGLSNVCFVQQTPEAIDAGVFHNDVIAVANESVLLLHESAFLNQKAVLRELQEKVEFPLTILEISKKQLSLQDAVKTYFFNSQLITLPDQTMLLLAPEDCEHHPKAKACIEALLQDPFNPIVAVRYVNLKQSMENGGGPACLRLRVPLSKTAFNSMHQGVILTEALYHQLERWIEQHYRDRLSFQDLVDPSLIDEVARAMAALKKILRIM